MKTKKNAILIHEDDNVVTVTVAVEKGSVVVFKKNNDIIKLNASDDIPVFHKVAVSDIKSGAPVYKYGQTIGEAIINISKGRHVHDHNIESPK